jgi:integrase
LPPRRRRRRFSPRSRRATGRYGRQRCTGLRRGELQALRWEDVDLPTGVIPVERSWDPKEGPIETKSRAGRRAVPIAAVLRDFLVEHKLASGRHAGLVFGRTAEEPFDPRALARRAETAWRQGTAKPLEPISLHECRHTFASLMIAAGVNAKALATYMGHSSVTVTLDRYGHLMPGRRRLRGCSTPILRGRIRRHESLR